MRLFLVLIASYSVILSGLLALLGPDLGGFPFVWVAVIWSVLNALDAHSTILFVSRSGPDREGNPLARWVMKRFGVVRGLVGFKLLFVPALHHGPQ